MIPLAPRFGTLVLLVENSEDGSHAQFQIGVATNLDFKLLCRWLEWLDLLYQTWKMQQPSVSILVLYNIK